MERVQGWAKAKSDWEQGPEALRLAGPQARNLNPLLCREGEEGAHLLWFRWLDRAGLIEGQLLASATEGGYLEWTHCAWEGGVEGQYIAGR